MEKFTSLTAVAAPLDMINVDTDMIIPKQFLKTIKRTGLGANLFDEMRFDRDGNEVEDFVDVVRHYGPIFGEGARLVRAAATFAGEPTPLRTDRKADKP